MSNLDQNVFGKKKFSDILKEIHDKQQTRDQQISGLISELKPLIADIGDATLIVPLIKDYLEIGIKNDEVLVKMATIVNRALSSSNSGEESFGISDEEKAQLMAEMDKLTKKDGK